MPHFSRFATDKRLQGIRINSAMMELSELDNEFKAVRDTPNAVPLYYDIKGRQLRIRSATYKDNHLEVVLNHPIRVNTPCPVLFKAGEDFAVLNEVCNVTTTVPSQISKVEYTQVLIFQPLAPKFRVKAGESICIRDPSFKVLGDTFPSYEIEKIKRVVASGLFTRYVLSYVESQRDIDQFRELVGKDVEIIAKIENVRGLEWVANGFKRQPNLSLMAARGDLYIEVDKPHEILNAMKLIIGADPNAMVGSRILLSCVNREVPDAVDFSELAWLYDIGYRRMMLCDDLCIKEDRLARAVNAFNGFRDHYAQDVPVEPAIDSTSPWKRRLSKIFGVGT